MLNRWYSMRDNDAGVVLTFFGRQALTLPGNFLIATGVLIVFIGFL